MQELKGPFDWVAPTFNICKQAVIGALLYGAVSHMWLGAAFGAVSFPFLLWAFRDEF